MRILTAVVSNFGSYESLEFDFDEQGLVLLSGPTGSGKSTLCDVIPWILFGVTSKGGKANEVRMWGTSEPTTGKIAIQIDEHRIFQVTRTRGKANDLYYEDNKAGAIRGKDLLDTQKQIDRILGMDAELYLSGAYFHTFSQTASFFTANATIRRAISEQLVDLTLAKDLTERLAEAKKTAKTNVTDLKSLLATVGAQVDYGTLTVGTTKISRDIWDADQAEKIKKTKLQIKNFEKDKAARIAELEDESIKFETQVRSNMMRYEQEMTDLKESLLDEPFLQASLEDVQRKIRELSDERCHECGSKLSNDNRLMLVKEENRLKTEIAERRNVKRAIENLKALHRVESNKENPYSQQAQVEHLRPNALSFEDLENEVNPFVARLKKEQEQLAEHLQDKKALQEALEDVLAEQTDLDLLANVVGQFRGALVKRAIKELESRTNALLTKHFDAELRVTFDVEEADKLEVAIMKDGNECSYAQLSKGQRQLLRLCFGVAVMKVVANHNAVKFNALFFDEFADGCDDDVKTKVYGLLEELATEYSSVFAIDHSETLKSMFSTRYDIKLVNGKSVVEKAL